jgi:hypothetical protein
MGFGEVMVIRLDIEIWDISKGGTKRRERVGEGRVLRAVEFCDPCLGVFLLL